MVEADLSGNINNGTVTGAVLANHAPVGRFAPFHYSLNDNIGADVVTYDTNPLPTSPYMPLFAAPQFCAYTPAVAFTDVLNYEIRLGANGSMGGFRFQCPDELGLLYDKVVKNHRIILMLRQGPVERRYTGIIQRRRRIQSTRRGVRILEVQGYGYGVFLARRNKAVDYASRGIYSILKSAGDGLNLAVTEIVFGNYIANPNVTISTTGKKRSLMSVMKELQVRAGSSATTPWTFWVCHGEHLNEGLLENLHFREKQYRPTPIVISENEILTGDFIDTVEFLQNQVEVEYGSAGLTEIRDNSASQTDWGKIYEFTEAPFLTTAAGAQDWGDKWLNRTKDAFKGESIAVPFNLFIEPNTTIRIVGPLKDQTYEVINVMHRGNEREQITVFEGGTTTL